MKLLQINPVIRTNTSTGRIMREIGEMAASHGWESYVAYSGGRDGMAYDAPVIKAAGAHNLPIPVGGKLNVILHGLETRLLDRHGLGSRLATKRFIKTIKEIDPDIIHIHNIHGYFLNYKIFFDYLVKSGKPVIWTVHDCWLYTGHCYHYSSISCMKWKTLCQNCPQKKAFPSSYLIDRSKKNYLNKKKAFTAVNNITFVTVSEWMQREMRESFLKDCNFKVIHNGIDTDLFYPRKGSYIRSKLKIGDKHILLGIASKWLKEKGIEDFIQLSNLLNDNEIIILIGQMSESISAQLPNSIITLSRTDSQNVLTELYSEALALVNPTWQDNYPTVNLEAMSCGTPVITYRTGGSIEAITEETGFIVEQGDVQGLLNCVRKIEKDGKEQYSSKCRERALKNFRKKDRYEEYLELYNKCLRK